MNDEWRDGTGITIGGEPIRRYKFNEYAKRRDLVVEYTDGTVFMFVDVYFTAMGRDLRARTTA